MRRPRVLVLHDEQSWGRLLGELLTAAGFEPSITSSPLEATRRALRERFEAVVVGLDTPVMSGAGLVELFRDNERLRELPVVLLSDAPVPGLADGARKLTSVSRSRVSSELIPAVRAAATAVVGREAG